MPKDIIFYIALPLFKEHPMESNNFELPTSIIRAVKLTAAGEKSVRQEHPWVFENSVSKVDIEFNTGDVAVIYGKKSNKLIGVGLLDSESMIQIRMISFGKGARLEQEFFNKKINEAFAQRVPLLKTDTTSFRLIFGESDGMPGCIVDVYEHAAVMKWYSLCWQPFLPLLTEAILSLNEQLKSLSRKRITTIVLRLARNVAKSKFLSKKLRDGMVIHGKLVDEVVVFREYGVQFSAHLIKGHKTGYFLDHRENRRIVGTLAQNKNVLDVFSYAGGFSVHALAGDAQSVTSVDISKQALELAKENAKLNGNFKNHKCLAGDAFEIMTDLVKSKKKFDLIVVDPPSFAKRADEIPSALNSYKRLINLALRLAAKNAILVMASCSSRVTSDDFFSLIESAAKQAMKARHMTTIQSYEIIDKTFHDIDHPINFPEGAYLKTIYLRLT